jgi:uncharacterized protein (DUF2252 family)
MNATKTDVPKCNSAGIPCEKGGTDASEDRPQGRFIRSATPRSSHAVWNPGDRTDPITTLQETSIGRLEPLIPIRYGRMLESPLAFLRGAPLIMARDLSQTPRTGITVQACGDAHLLNFGLFASPERELLFDLNDFDETLAGPWEWDVKRLAVSLAVASREFGLPDVDCGICARTCVRSYRENINRFSRMPLIDVWYSRVEGETFSRILTREERRHASKEIDKAHKRNHRQAISELTEDETGRLRFKDDPPVISHAHDLLSGQALDRILSTYRESLQEDRRHLFDGYQVVDYALKVVGIGSVGTRCFAVLFGSSHKNDCLVLQVKEATPSVLEGLGGPAWYGNQGQRTVTGQRLIQGFSDIFLGWGSDGERDYYVRQLRDMKGQLSPTNASSDDIYAYARLCGWVLARAHARSGNASLISGYLGKSDVFDEAISQFAVLYADQNQQDFEVFESAVRSGRLPADRGI